MKISIKPEDKRMISEKAFEGQIRDLAKIFGWKYYHTWRSIHSSAGYPDCCLVRLSRLIFAELKSEKGKISPAQQEWLGALTATGKCEVYLWMPWQINEITAILR